MSASRLDHLWERTNACDVGYDKQRMEESQCGNPSRSARSSITVTAKPHCEANFARACAQCPAPTRQKNGARACGSMKTVTSPPQIAPNDSSLASCRG